MNRVEIKIRTGGEKQEIVSIQTIGVPIVINYEDIAGESIAVNKIYDNNLRITIKDGKLTFGRGIKYE